MTSRRLRCWRPSALRPCQKSSVQSDASTRKKTARRDQRRGVVEGEPRHPHGRVPAHLQRQLHVRVVHDHGVPPAAGPRQQEGQPRLEQPGRRDEQHRRLQSQGARRLRVRAEQGGGDARGQDACGGAAHVGDQVSFFCFFFTSSSFFSFYVSFFFPPSIPPPPSGYYLLPERQ